MSSTLAFRLRVLERESELLRVLRESYGIAEFAVLEGAAWNLNLRAIANDGATVFVKVINEETVGWRRSTETWHQVLNYQERLAASGCRLVVAPIRNRAHETLTEWQRRKIIAYPWVDHKIAFELSEQGPQAPEVAKTGGTLLAELHDAMDTVVGTIAEGEPIPLCQSPTQWAAHLPELRATVLGHLERRGEATDSTLATLAEVYASALELVHSGSPFFRPPPRDAGVIHGDFRPENILTTSSRGKVVIDLDLLYEAPRVVDVALGALNYAGPRFLEGPRQWNRVWQFIDSYRARRRLDDHDISVALGFGILRSALTSFKSTQLAERTAIYRSLPR